MQAILFSRRAGIGAVRGLAGLVLAGVCGTALSAVGFPAFEEKYQPDLHPTPRVSCPQSAELPRSLIAAAACGDVFRVRARLAEGADVSVTDSRPRFKGRTALHHAVQLGNAEIVGLMLAAGARGDAVDSQGNTPLHLLGTRPRSAEESAIARALINVGVDARVRNAAGRTPLGELLHFARHDIDPLRLSRIPLAVLLDEAEATGPIPIRGAVAAVPVDPVRVVAVEDKPVAAVAIAPAVTAPAQGNAGASTQGAAPKEDAVRSALDSWLAAWSARDAEAYIGHYAASFRPADGSSVDAWRGQRRARLGAAHSIQVTVSDLQVKVDGAHAVAQFKQDYRSDSFKSLDHKILVLVPEGSDWRIAEEKTSR
ncbi:MAG TPA: ankyrin repeat domain-containing protein [Aromatoleum sp.]|uniref:L,D-transpeptidase Cds6 family protein n=1 Tax=Aromatoleum sp. TaxID=2307007 RepID=UPI002B463501|nr:ankyrin repeat domain-containing protein [Aromatoleum sp.]HJV28076.1 ankyrin repeat domain-containing protein [Aromatoleum sp.]